MATTFKRTSQSPQLTKKALETREKLKDTARDLINAHGYSGVRVEDITQAAGVAKGLFYRYFTDLNNITSEICEELFQNILDISLAKKYTPDVAPYDWLYDYISVPVDQFSNNPGLLACMFELHGSFPDISQAWTVSGHDWNLHLSDFIQKSLKINKKDAEPFCFILGAVMEGILYQNIIRKNDDLKKIASSAPQVTEAVAMTWYRLIFLDVPPVSRTKIKCLLSSS